MIAAVALYAIVVGGLLAVVGVLADRAAALRRRARRWVWVGALAATIALAVTAPWRATTFESTAATLVANPTPVAVVAGADTAETSRSSWTTVRASIRERVEAVATFGADLDPLLARIWLVGSVTIAVIVLAGWLALARRRRLWRDAIVDDERVLVAPVTGPAVVGLVSPRIVLPEWALTLDAASIHLILRHEREHVRAGDAWLMHFAVAAVVAMPWNPLVWWMASRLRLAVELDCDARVVGMHADSGADALAYGELLLAVVERRPRRRLLAAPALVETSSSLGRRIAALFPDVVRFAAARAAVAVVAAFSIAGIVTMVPLPRVAAAPAVTAVDAGAVEPDVARPATSPMTLAEPEAAIELSSARPTPAPENVAPTYAQAAATRSMEMAIEDATATPVEPTPALATTAELAAAAAPLSAPALSATLPAPPPALAPEPVLARARAYDAATTPGLVLPVPLRVERPRYTNAAMRERLSGTVLVEAVVGADGRVENARLLKSLDAEFGLDEAALDAAKRSVFRPGTLDGEPVAATVMLELAFTIH